MSQQAKTSTLEVLEIGLHLCGFPCSLNNVWDAVNTPKVFLPFEVDNLVGSENLGGKIRLKES